MLDNRDLNIGQHNRDYDFHRAALRKAGPERIVPLLGAQTSGDLAEPLISSLLAAATLSYSTDYKNNYFITLSLLDPESRGFFIS